MKELILRESLPPLGKAGDVVRVADGYARNFLLPLGKTVVADPKNLAQVERQRASILARAAKQSHELQALAVQLGQVALVIPVRVGEGDRLYGSVTSTDIADAIANRGFRVDRRKIALEEPIKSLGEYEVPVKLGSDVTAVVKVRVVSQE